MLNYCANGPSGYNLSNSLRFRSSASAYLSRTPASAGNQKTWTYSLWLKRGTLSTVQNLLVVGTNITGQQSTQFGLNNDNTIQFFDGLAGVSTSIIFDTTQVFRDPSAWYHIVLAVDTTQATSANRVKMYVNGNQITAFTSSTYPSQNFNTLINAASIHYIGRFSNISTNYFDGYLTEVNLIDGQALTPSSFGSTNPVTGVWQPAKYTGTYGTNGFYLPFTLNSTSTYQGQFNGSNQYLQVATNSAFDLSTGDATVEFWMNPDTQTQTIPTILGSIDYNTSTSSRIGFSQTGNTNQMFIYWNGAGNPIIASNLVMTVNQWYHIALVRQSTTLKLYINGALDSTATVSSSLGWNLGYGGFRIGRGFDVDGANAYYKGYVSNVRLVKGTAVYTANFVPPTSPLTAISGTSILTLQNSSIVDNSTNAFSITNNNSVATSTATPFVANIADDASGNNNNWLTKNINYSTVGTTYDSMTDVPTLTSATVGNYCTINPLLDLQTYATYSEGNLKVSTTASAGYSMRMQSKGTMAIPSSGKWYFAANAGDCGIIIGNDDPNRTQYGASILTTNVRYQYNGDVLLNNNSYATVASFTVSDEVGFAIDMDALTVGIYKNGSLLTTVTGVTSGFTYYPMTIAGSSSTSYTAYWNFGQRPFAYTPPTGYKTLNTYNLPTSTIVQGNKYMDATLYTGTAANQTVVNAGSFQPDLVWTKGRSYADYQALTDSVRGASIWLSSNTTSAEANYTGTNSGVKSFVSNGFTLQADGSEVFNKLSATYVGWQWQAGQGTTSSNTQGTITTTTSVNTTAGFSVFTFTGTGSSASVGHGLGVAPKFMIFKRRNSTSDWNVLTNAAGSNQYGFLNLTTAFAAAGETWTSTVINIGGNFVNGGTYVCYAWAEIAGFSKFGSYTGNGSTDGVFIYTGFRPKFFLWKRTDTSVHDWNIIDSSRDTYNVTFHELAPNTSAAEYTATNELDFVANGIKLRATDNTTNASGGNYIYAAFAENPFKNALAR